jgi:hypothetical protein
MAETYRGGYRGANWPTETYTIDLYGGPLAKVYTGWNEVRGELRDAFDRAVEAVKGDGDLTQSRSRGCRPTLSP